MASLGEIVSYTGFTVGILSFAYALWADRKRKRMTDIVRQNNWLIFQRMGNVTGMIQLSLKIYKEKHKDSLDADVVETLSKSDAHGQEVFLYQPSEELTLFSLLPPP
jgi:hypothetical protein